MSEKNEKYSDDPIENAKALSIFNLLNSKEELRDWLYVYFDIWFPMGVVYPTSTHGPVDAIWRIYELIKTGKSEFVPETVMLASRDSGKTLNAAALQVLCMIHFKIPIAHMAAISSQSAKSIQYVNLFFRKVKPYMIYSGWRQISDNKKMIEWITPDGDNVYLKIIIATISGANSEHVPLLCVDKNTVLKTNLGHLKAKDVFLKIEKGEKIRVLSFNHSTGELEYKEISKTWKNKKNKAIKIKYNNQELTVSPEHKVFVKNRGYIEAKDVGKGDVLIRIKNDRSSLLAFHGKRRTIDFIKNKINGFKNITLLSNIYENNCSPIELSCSLHGDFKRKWNKIDDRVKRGLNPCQKCNMEGCATKQRMGEDEIRRDAEDNGFKVLLVERKFNNAKDLVHLSCSKGHIFKTIINNFRNNHSCTKCVARVSNIQKEMEQFVSENYNKKIESNCRDAIKPLEIDVYMPDIKYGLELDGLYWHCETLKPDIKKANKEKIKKVRQEDISVNFFYEDEWRDGSKREIVKSLILNKINSSKIKKIRASKCQVVKLRENKKFKDFFEKNHISGNASSSFAYALLVDGEIISCMSFRKKFTGQTWEIARFCSKLNTRVYGAASKLLNKMIEEYSPKTVLSYSDNRIGNGGVYQKLGFKNITVTAEPSYYYTDFKTRVFRTKCQRINDPEILKKYPTEREQARGGIFSEKLLGHKRPLHRVYDYGHLKWELKIEK